MSDKQYIGDSVYISFDGFHLVLTTENGSPNDPSNVIYLEPDFPERLIKYREYIYSKYKEKNNGSDKRNSDDLQA